MHRRPWLVTTTLMIATSCSSPGGPPATAAVERYRASFHESAGSRLVATCDRDELATALRSVRVLWLGDQHGSSRVHALQSELLTDLMQRGFRLALVLEAIGKQDEPAVRRYLAGETTMKELRTTVKQRWDGSWLDDPELDPWFYRSLLMIARSRQPDAQRDGIVLAEDRQRALDAALPVLALEPTPRAPLAERDEKMAAVVREAAAMHSDRLIVVIVGQTHLLGEGDLVGRTGLPSLAIGAEPRPVLHTASEREARGTLRQSDGGIWWFGELLRTPD